jgi:hypothetical protein
MPSKTMALATVSSAAAVVADRVRERGADVDLQSRTPSLPPDPT